MLGYIVAIGGNTETGEGWVLRKPVSHTIPEDVGVGVGADAESKG
jgi:hypothetical protein